MLLLEAITTEDISSRLTAFGASEETLLKELRDWIVAGHYALSDIACAEMYFVDDDEKPPVILYRIVFKSETRYILEPTDDGMIYKTGGIGWKIKKFLKRLTS